MDDAQLPSSWLLQRSCTEDKKEKAEQLTVDAVLAFSSNSRFLYLYSVFTSLLIASPFRRDVCSKVYFLRNTQKKDEKKNEYRLFRNLITVQRLWQVHDANSHRIASKHKLIIKPLDVAKNYTVAWRSFFF